MKDRVLIPLGLALACALHVQVTGQVVAPALAGVVGLVAALVGPRWSLAQAAQALVFVATAGLVFAAAVIDPPLGVAAGGPKLQYVIFSGAALMTVATRLGLSNPERGHTVTWAIGLLSFYCCGRVASEAYLPLVVAYLGFAWLHTAWGGRPSGRQLAVGLGLLLLTAAGATSTTLGLRRAYQNIDDLIIASAGQGEVGFGAGSFRLGSMDGMRDSNEVILRVYGPADEHFRGQAYTAYGGGAWFPPDGGVERVQPGAAPSGEVTVIEFVAAEQERLFLPPEAGAVRVEPSGVVVDRLGSPRPAGDDPLEVRFDTSSPRFPSPAATDADLLVPPDVSEAIGPLVARWTEGASSPAERIERIVERLEQDYTYSLHYDREADRDPVVQFLVESRLGHCEYFASGLALSARSAGVPSRVVTGFRSNETSPFSGHRIVRARDAHAWAEVWLDGAWVQVDPSPQNIAQGTFFSGATDDARLAWDRYGLQALVALLVLVFVALQVRTLLRNRNKPPAVLDEGWVEGPPPYLMALLEALARQELTRLPAEPVEAFADRADEAGSTDAAALLRRYAALRYGGAGDPEALAADVRQVTGA